MPSMSHGPRASIRRKEGAKMDVFEKILQILADQLDIKEKEKITMESDIVEDLEADSLDVVDLIMSLEDEFGVEVPDDAIENFHTVGDIVRYVEDNL